MHSFEETALWRKGFDVTGNHAQAAQHLKSSLLKMRERAAHLVSLIRKDLPHLTIHDVTHLDALWETASLISGPNYSLNPCEAFVFGAAILLHDSAMSFAAYPGGEQEIRNTPEWKDAVASRFAASYPLRVDAEALKRPPNTIARAALLDVLRENHAKQAEKLPFISWKNKSGDPECLLEDSELRVHYGPIIGKIAASHWWTISELRQLQERINASESVPSDWHISPIKVACLLRVADAAHIDARRAPRFLRSLVGPKDEAAVHWSFQEKIGKPSSAKNLLVYTGGPYGIDEVESWWLGYDLISLVDEELGGVDSVLEEFSLPRFSATAVKGARNPSTLSKMITTNGWTPVETGLRVSDVPSLVDMLGGEKLYGDDLGAPVRELLQNAKDAIRARKLFDNNFEPNVTVRLKRGKTSDHLEVEDCGIGMSLAVLTGPLLDFGRSFWRSSMARREFPGLLSRGLRTTGRFGIGFFSVFMLGSEVRVTTHRYDLGVADGHTLDFSQGLRVRPIVRNPSAAEMLLNPGTRVSVRLHRQVDEHGGLLYEDVDDKIPLIDVFALFVSKIAPLTDVNIWVDIDGVKKLARKANAWRLSKASEMVLELASSTRFAESNAKHMRLLADPKTKEVYGRAAFYIGPFYERPGVVAVGGFAAAPLYQVVGYLKGEAETVARQSASPIVPGHVLKKWASGQVSLIAKARLLPNVKLHLASIALQFGVNVSNLPIAICGGSYLKEEDLKRHLKKNTEVCVFEGTEIEFEEDDDVRPSSFKHYFEVRSDLLLVPERSEPVLTVGNKEWPSYVPGLHRSYMPTSCVSLFERILSAVWKNGYDEENKSSVVGSVEGEQITRVCTVYTKL